MQNTKYTVIEPDHLKRELEEKNRWLIADVRPKAEFITQHIPGSVNVPSSELPRFLDGVGSKRNIVLVCNNGKLARRSALRLESDQKNLFVLEGGVMLWRSSGFPTDHRILSVPEEAQLDVIFGIGAVFSAAMVLSVAPILMGIGFSFFAADCVLDTINRIRQAR